MMCDKSAGDNVSLKSEKRKFVVELFAAYKSRINATFVYCVCETILENSL